MKSNATYPSFSIVTVCFNAELVIELTIKSVLEQTYRNIEYIIIDGASTDCTVDIIKKYNDKISNWVSEPDKGIFDAMNKGIKHSKGKYIAFINAGDYYEQDACEKIAKYITRYPNIGVFYGNVNIIVSSIRNKYKYNLLPALVVDDRIMVSPLFCHQSCFVKKELFTNLGGFEKVNIAGDWLHFVKLYINKVSFMYVNETIANYLDGGISTTVKGFKESFKYKKQFGSFRKKDYITLLFFYIKDNFIFRSIINPFLWTLKVALNSNRYFKINE